MLLHCFDALRLAEMRNSYYSWGLTYKKMATRS